MLRAIFHAYIFVSGYCVLSLSFLISHFCCFDYISLISLVFRNAFAFICRPVSFSSLFCSFLFFSFSVEPKTKRKNLFIWCHIANMPNNIKPFPFSFNFRHNSYDFGESIPITFWCMCTMYTVYALYTQYTSTEYAVQSTQHHICGSIIHENVN